MGEFYVGKMCLVCFFFSYSWDPDDKFDKQAPFHFIDLEIHSEMQGRLQWTSATVITRIRQYSGSTLINYQWMPWGLVTCFSLPY